MRYLIKARLGDDVILTKSRDNIIRGEIRYIDESGFHRYHIKVEGEDEIVPMNKYDFVIIPKRSDDVRVGGILYAPEASRNGIFLILRTDNGMPRIVCSGDLSFDNNPVFIDVGYSNLLPEGRDVSVVSEERSPTDKILLDSMREYLLCLTAIKSSMELCHICEKECDGYRRSTVFMESSKYYCSDCATDEYYKCSLCDGEFTVIDTNKVIFRGEDCCNRCVEKRVFMCVRCDEVNVSESINTNAGYHNNDRYCRPCFDYTLLENFMHPPAMIDRRSLANIILDNGSTSYKSNKSKTPVSLEIELIGDEEDLDNIERPAGWRLVSDGSLSEGGAELIMSPRSGDALGESIHRACDWADDYGYYPDRTCGIHVHTNALDLGVNEMKGIILTVKILEDFIYKMIPPDREFKSYSKRMANFKRKDLLKIKNAGDLSRFWYEDMSNTHSSATKYNESRYRGFNAHSRFFMGTVEYRYHEGSKNPKRIYDWAKFCLAITDFGKNLMDRDDKILNMFLKDNNHKLEDYLDVMGIIEMYNTLNSRINEYRKARDSYENPRTSIASYGEYSRRLSVSFEEATVTL